MQVDYHKISSHISVGCRSFSKQPPPFAQLPDPASIFALPRNIGSVTIITDHYAFRIHFLTSTSDLTNFIYPNKIFRHNCTINSCLILQKQSPGCGPSRKRCESTISVVPTDYRNVFRRSKTRLFLQQFQDWDQSMIPQKPLIRFKYCFLF